MNLQAWAELIYIDPKIKIRATQSRHQEYISTFLELVKQARETPSDELKQKLIAIRYIRCDGKGDHVFYARYLQHGLSHLRNEGEVS